MKFRPLHDRVVSERIDAEAKTAGGIIIPDTAQEKPQQGQVIAIGPGGRDESGKLIPIDVKVGNLPPEIQGAKVMIAADPDEARCIHADAVFILRPVIALAGAAPGLDQIAFAIELHDRRRWAAAFGGRRIKGQRLLVIGERSGALYHPDMILRVHSDARGLTHYPVIWQRRGPCGVDLKAGNVIG